MSRVRRLFSTDTLRRTISCVLRRFPFPFCLAAIFTVWEVISLYVWTPDFDFIFKSVSWAVAEAFMLTLAVNLWCEFSEKRRFLKPALISATLLAGADLALMLVRGGTGNDAETIGRFAFFAALVSAILFLPAVKRYTRAQLWEYTVRQFEAVATAACIALVLTVAMFIFFNTVGLLFGVRNYKITMTAVCLFGLFLPVVLYLWRIPRRRAVLMARLMPRTAVGAFCRNVQLPLVAGYTLILYVYAANILFTWTLPKASVTWMVTGLMLATLIMLYGIQRYTFGGFESSASERVALLVRRWAPVILLPLLVLMSIGLIYRVREYGITVSRLYVAAFNVWAYSVVFYLLLKRNAGLNVVAVSFALVFAIVSMIPGLNFTSIANRIIRNDVIASLQDAGAEHFPLTAEETRSLLAGLEERKAESVASKIEYLDGWDDHSEISDIVASDRRLFDYELLPEQYVEEVVEVVFSYNLETDGVVTVPEGYDKVIKYDMYNRPLSLRDNGCAASVFGDYSIWLNVDSLCDAAEGSSPLTSPAVSVSGDSAVAVFTQLAIDADADTVIRRAEFYLFTK